MNRTGLALALGLAVAVGLIFALWPELDLKLSALFFDPGRGGFWRSYDPFYLRVRDAFIWLIALIAVPAGLAPLVKLTCPHRRLLLPGRAVLLMLVTLAVGPGILTNLVLKDHWGRSRPIAVTEFGGTEQFRPWWDPRGDCRDNCSFVAGEPSGAFWTLAPAVLAPPPWRVPAIAAALGFAAAVGAMRIAAGAHFFTDVAFAGVLTFALIWLTHGLLYRWRRTRIADAWIEGLIERLAIRRK